MTSEESARRRRLFKVAVRVYRHRRHGTQRYCNLIARVAQCTRAYQRELCDQIGKIPRGCGRRGAGDTRVLAGAYDLVNHTLVWDTIQTELVLLLGDIEKLLAESKRNKT